MSTIAAMLKAAEDFRKITTSIDWVEFERMRQKSVVAMIEAHKILASPWVAEVISAADKATRNYEKLVAATRTYKPTEMSLADSIWLRPQPRFAPPDPEPPAPPKRRIGF